MTNPVRECGYCGWRGVPDTPGICRNCYRALAKYPPRDPAAEAAALFEDMDKSFEGGCQAQRRRRQDGTLPYSGEFGDGTAPQEPEGCLQEPYEVRDRPEVDVEVRMAMSVGDGPAVCLTCGGLVVVTSDGVEQHKNQDCIRALAIRVGRLERRTFRTLADDMGELKKGLGELGKAMRPGWVRKLKKTRWGFWRKRP